jgi:hypothetical protein
MQICRKMRHSYIPNGIRSHVRMCGDCTVRDHPSIWLTAVIRISVVFLKFMRWWDDGNYPSRKAVTSDPQIQFQPADLCRLFWKQHERSFRSDGSFHRTGVHPTCGKFLIRSAKIFKRLMSVVKPTREHAECLRQRCQQTESFTDGSVPLLYLKRG